MSALEVHSLRWPLQAASEPVDLTQEGNAVRAGQGLLALQGRQELFGSGN